MHKKLLELLSTIILALVPFLALSEEIETKISADMIAVENGEVLFAEGNVIVQHGSRTIRAKSLKFNQKTNKIKFTGIQEFYDGDGIKLSADEALISGDLSQGVISTVKLVLDHSIKIQSSEARLKDGEISSVTGISRVTSCEECEKEQPNWHLTASSANRDVENSNIIYRNVTVRLKGLPVAYIPYLRMPDPTVSRATGFLVPEAALTSNLESGLKLPYFVPLGMSSDILIIPYFSSKTHTLEYRYRKKFRNGNLTVKGAFSDDDLMEGNLRYFSQMIGNFELGYGIELDFNAGKVGDSSYLGDYVYSEQSDFNSEISLEKTVVEKDQFFDGKLSYLREKEKVNSLDEYYYFFGSYVREISDTSLPGKLRLSANLNSTVNINDDNNVSRPPSSAMMGLDYNQSNFLSPVRLTTDFFGRFNSFVNSADSGATNEEFSLQYGAATLISIPVYLRGQGKVSVINPEFSLSFNEQENDIQGSYFIGMEELSWGNIAASKKIMSLTESEIGPSISFGLNSQVFWDTGQRLEIALAASKIDRLTYESASTSDLTSGKLNYLGKFYYQSVDGNYISGDTLFSSKGHLLKGDLKSHFSRKRVALGAGYAILNEVMDSRLSENLRTINLLSSYNFSENFLVSADSHYDLSKAKMSKASIGVSFAVGLWDYELNQEYLEEQREKLSLAAIYDDDCTRLTFSFESRYQELGSSAPVKSLMFRVQLKPFASFVFSQGGDQITF